MVVKQAGMPLLYGAHHHAAGGKWIRAFLAEMPDGWLRIFLAQEPCEDDKLWYHISITFAPELGNHPAQKRRLTKQEKDDIVNQITEITHLSLLEPFKEEGSVPDLITHFWSPVI